MTTATEKIKAGDTILHRPSGEKWLVAATRRDELVCYGWPESIAKLDDCDLIESCTDEEHIAVLMEVSRSRTSVRSNWAYHALAERPDHFQGGGI